MYGIHEVLRTQVRADYSENLATGSYQLDCSMGANPYGAFPGLKIEPDILSTICDYPYDEPPLKAAIRDLYAPVADLTDDMIAFSCGSIGSVMTVNRMVLRPGKVVISLAPTFSAVTDDILTYEPVFHYVYLRPERNYQFDLDDLLAAVHAHPGAYIYIDTPNNPTGQIFPLDEMRTVVTTAEKLDSFVLLDEAYGDYMPLENSGVSLVHEFANTAVIRTFAKGMGAAGIRLGYTIGHPDVIAAFNKVNIPFSVGTITNSLARQLLASDWIEQSVARIQVDKAKALAALQNLRVGYTYPTVPISLVYADDPACDVSALLLEHGIRVISCEEYEGLGSFAARLNLHHDIETLVQLLRQADESYGSRKGI
jgi:histidinol-phosphate aminotransferase